MAVDSSAYGEGPQQVVATLVLKDGSTGPGTPGINPLSTEALCDFFEGGGSKVDPDPTWPYASRPTYIEPDTTKNIQQLETGPEFAVSRL